MPIFGTKSVSLVQPTVSTATPVSVVNAYSVTSPTVINALPVHKIVRDASLQLLVNVASITSSI